MSRSLALLLAAIVVPACQTTTQTISRERIAEIVTSPDRSAADRTNDQRRKPEQMLAFIGIRPGMVAMDLSAGGGYTTELVARAARPESSETCRTRSGSRAGSGGAAAH
jgi:predicted methyltransferase